MNRLKNTGEMLIPSVAYGDAAGLPVEAKSVNYIRKKHGKISALLPPIENPFYDTNLPAGTWSDDTQLTLAVANAIIRAQNFTIESQIQTHVAAYYETPEVTDRNGKVRRRGWGGSTTHSIERLIDGASPTLSGEVNGAGNGVLMKMSPLVLWQAGRGVSDDKRYEQYDQLTTMTHDSDVARLCTRLHGDTLIYLMNTGQDFNRDDFAQYIVASARDHEQRLGMTMATSESLQFLGAGQDLSSDDILTQFENTTSGFKYGFYAPETLMIAYAAFLSKAPNFHESVYMAANIGGDSDSTSSIVASMVNFVSHGGYEKPHDFAATANYEYLSGVSMQLAAVALRHS